MRFLAVLFALPAALAAQAPLPPPTLDQLLDARRLDEAKPVVDGMLARDKSDPNALFYMGRYVYAQQKSGEAVDWFEKAIERNDRSSTYHLWLGKALGDEAQNASKFRQPFLARRVKNEFERAVQLDPKSIEARSGLVDFYSMAPGIMGGSMSEARAQAGEIARLDSIRGHLEFAKLALRQKDAPAAEREYRAAIANAPDSAAGYYGLASFFRNQSRWDEAFATYDQLLKLKPEEVTAHMTWAGTAAQSGKNLERGEREAKLFLADPKGTSIGTISNAHWRLGQIYEQTARKELARAEYNAALKIWPQNPNVKKSLEGLR